MSSQEASWNILLMVICYAYIILIIFISSKLNSLKQISRKTSRKFLHAMIGNLPFLIPFFTQNIYPFLVAAPFILVTFLASSYSPFKIVNEKLKGLTDITEEGHHLGLVFYSISYTILALFLASKAYVVAAGILPMAYGDSAASVVGGRYGKRRYRFLANKSLEGSAAMFLVSFSSLLISLYFFSTIYAFSFLDKVIAAFAASVVATVSESLSPLGFDNLTVPILSASTFLLVGGGA